MTQEQSRSEIIRRSNAKTWEAARLEWMLKNVWWSEDHETCFCGHHPIREICELENRVNGKTTEVGNCCINRFLGLDYKNVFVSIRKVRKDAGASFNEATVLLAHQRRIIREKDKNFYLNIWRKRELSEALLKKWKNDINRRIMARFVKNRPSG